MHERSITNLLPKAIKEPPGNLGVETSRSRWRHQENPVALKPGDKVGVDAFKRYRNLAPEGYNAFSVENTDENEPQPDRWPAEALRCLQDDFQNHIPLHQHWRKVLAGALDFVCNQGVGPYLGVLKVNTASMLIIM